MDSNKKLTAILTLFVTWPTTLLIGIVIGYSFNFPFTADTLSSWVTAIATVAITILTFILAKETQELRLAQEKQIRDLQLENIKPSINIVIAPGKVGIKFFDFHVSNFGKGIARNIKFNLSGRNPEAPDQETSVLIGFLNNLAPIRSGIHSLGINQKFSSYAFSVIDLGSKTNGQIFKPFVRIVVNYEDTLGTLYSDEFILDLSQYEGVSEPGTDATRQMADHLKSIKDSLKQMEPYKRGRFEVSTFTKKDRVEEQLEWERERAEFIKNHSPQQKNEG